MASSKLNIFSSLAKHDSDSEDEDNFQKSKTKKTTEKKEGGNKNDDKVKDNKSGPNRVTPGTNVPHRAEKEEHLRAKDTRKDKGVSAQPHPLDRHSGTNTHAYGTKEKKSGAGKGNWGKATGTETEEVGEETSPDLKAQAEEEKPSLTLQEYYAQQMFSQNEPQVNESKAKITSEHLKKELGNSTLLKSKHQQDVDDRKVGKKKERFDADHRAALTTEHGNLLGFRTGFVDKEYKKRDPEEAGQRRTGPRNDNRGEKREEGKVEEGAETSTQPTEQTQHGETTEQTTEQTAEGEATQQDNRRGGRGGRGGRGTRGGYRGGEGGHRGENRGEHRGEHRGEGGHRGEHRGDRGGNRRYEGGNQPRTQKPVVNDESAFPKLG